LDHSAASNATRTTRPAPTREWVPAQPGDALADVDTPALVVDLAKCEANLQRLMRSVAGKGVRVRPHAKTHKCAELARMQVEAGAIGVCCQKPGEAEALLAGGVGDVLITNEVVGEAKLRRLARLAWARAPAVIGVCVDSLEGARTLAEACAAEQAVVDVYIEVDVGQNRCGLADPAAVAALARQVCSAPSLRFRGLQAYSGIAQHRRGVPERRAAAAAAAQRAAQARQAVRDAGLPCEIVTGGGTGTFLYDVDSGVYDEVQPGSYLFMDIDYARNEPDDEVPRFENSLFVLASVMSVQGDRATLDAGLKAVSTDQGPPGLAFSGWRVRNLSDEHTVLLRTGEGTELRAGDKTLLLPGHCDPTVNLHDWIVAVRDGVVEAVWPVDARGRMY
jgi:3-hydroxy-D-aspartate aldolase